MGTWSPRDWMNRGTSMALDSERIMPRKDCKIVTLSFCHAHNIFVFAQPSRGTTCGMTTNMQADVMENSVCDEAANQRELKKQWRAHAIARRKQTSKEERLEARPQVGRTGAEGESHSFVHHGGRIRVHGQRNVDDADAAGIIRFELPRAGATARIRHGYWLERTWRHSRSAGPDQQRRVHQYRTARKSRAIAQTDLKR